MRIWKGIGLFFLALAVIAAAAATVWFTTFTALPAAALDPQQGIAALSAGISDLPADIKTQQAQLDALPAIAAQSGCDTLYYTVNNENGIGWRSKRFPAEPRLQHQELFGLAVRTLDVLDRLSDACAQQSIRLVAVLDVNDLADGRDGNAALDDGDFVTRLSAAVRDISAQYGVSAVVLRFADAPTDSSAARAAFSGMARQCAVPMGLELSASHGLLRTTSTGAALAVARVESSADAEAAAALAKVSAQDGLPVLWLAKQPQLLAAAAYYAAGQGLPVNSCIWGSVKQADLEPEALQSVQSTVLSVKQSGFALSVPEIGRTLAVSYPAQGATLYSENVYLMGTSDPAQPLAVNGAEVKHRARGGSFGVLVPLEKGENRILVTQGGENILLTVTRAEAAGGGAMQRDGTVKLYQGQRIRVTSWIASVLADPDNEDMIKETAKQGGVAVVNRCATTVRNGKYTYIYELTTGGWIPAYHCEAVNENIGPWPLADFAVTKDGRDEYITLVRGGTALGYDSWDEENSTLTVTLANTEAVQGEYAIASELVTGVKTELTNGGVRLIFSTDGARQLWGYDVTYNEAGDTVLYLKAAPQLAPDTARPLEGAVIVLDAGHGADDYGALGVAGALGGPKEKDLNLAVALAVRARLQQMGASVVMVREDDSFLSLEERSRLANEVHPDLYLALHHNSVELTRDAGDVTGTYAYYFTLPGKQLADCLLPGVAAAGGRPDRGSSWSYFYVTRMTYTPAVLLEYGFLVNPAEYEVCADPLTILRQGDATAQGILEFFRQRLR